jgi:AcrR family transcriptional regulator
LDALTDCENCPQRYAWARAARNVGSEIDRDMARLADSNTSRASSSYERIIRAAYLCFERHGIERTSIEDIAREAGVTRPTVYRYFKGGKLDIVDMISTEESRKINAEVRKRLVRGRTFEELLVEALVLVVRLAIQNPYVRRILSYHEFQAEAVSLNGEMHRLHRQWWGPLLEHAAERGELAGDLDIDEILVWLTLTQNMLLMRLEGVEVSDRELRRLVQRFVVRPLLARATTGNSDPVLT